MPTTAYFTHRKTGTPGTTSGKRQLPKSFTFTQHPFHAAAVQTYLHGNPAAEPCDWCKQAAILALLPFPSCVKMAEGDWHCANVTFWVGGAERFPEEEWGFDDDDPEQFDGSGPYSTITERAVRQKIWRLWATMDKDIEATTRFSRVTEAEEEVLRGRIRAGMRLYGALREGLVLVALQEGSEADEGAVTWEPHWDGDVNAGANVWGGGVHEGAVHGVGNWRDGVGAVNEGAPDGVGETVAVMGATNGVATTGVIETVPGSRSMRTTDEAAINAVGDWRGGVSGVSEGAVDGVEHWGDGMSAGNEGATDVVGETVAAVGATNVVATTGIREAAAGFRSMRTTNEAATTGVRDMPASMRATNQTREVPARVRHMRTTYRAANNEARSGTGATNGADDPEVDVHSTDPLSPAALFAIADFMAALHSGRLLGESARSATDRFDDSMQDDAVVAGDSASEDEDYYFDRPRFGRFN